MMMAQIFFLFTGGQKLVMGPPLEEIEVERSRSREKSFECTPANKPSHSSRLFLANELDPAAARALVDLFTRSLLA